MPVDSNYVTHWSQILSKHRLMPKSLYLTSLILTLKSFLYLGWNFGSLPSGTWRRNDVLPRSMRRSDVIITSYWRRRDDFMSHRRQFDDVVCLLGWALRCQGLAAFDKYIITAISSFWNSVHFTSAIYIYCSKYLKEHIKYFL